MPDVNATIAMLMLTTRLCIIVNISDENYKHEESTENHKREYKNIISISNI